MKAFKCYRIFYGLLLLAFFGVALAEKWGEAQKYEGQHSSEVIAATAAINGCIRFLEKAFLSPLGILAGVVCFVWWRRTLREEKTGPPESIADKEEPVATPPDG